MVLVIMLNTVDTLYAHTMMASPSVLLIYLLPLFTTLPFRRTIAYIIIAT